MWHLAWCLALRLHLLSFLVACCGVCFVARVCVTVEVCFLSPRVSSSLLQFMCAPLHVVVVLLCIVVGASSGFGVLFCLLFIIVIISTELLALCDGCLGWGLVWRAGLVAGLQLGQAFGMFLSPGFGVGSSSPWVPGHLTSMCDSGVKHGFLTNQSTRKVLSIL